MLRTVLELDDLKHLNDGKFSAAFRRRIVQILDDLEDRPTTKKARKLLISLSFEPVESNGDLDRVHVTAELEAKVPKQQGNPIEMNVTRKSGRPVSLVFNDLSPEDPNQRTLDQVGEEGTESNAG